MDTTKIVEAVKELAKSKSISEEDVGVALEEALTKTYLKILGGWEDAEIYCHVDIASGVIELGQIKTAVKEVEDDYVQVEIKEAEELLGHKVKEGEKVRIPAALEDFSKAITTAIKSNLRQRLAEAERSALYEIYKDHIGEMMVGSVEKADDRNVFVNIGRATVELTRRELIGDEYFKVGDPIKVYIQEVVSANDTENSRKRGPQIQATRSSEGFLKRLFEEEIHEIYDGTVIIKAIARQAGVRSKVAVYSNNEDVDATGACIGAGGSRIQKIVAQLGNGKVKEKIDIINYSPYLPLFIMEAVRPIQALGVYVDEELQRADVIVANDAYPSCTRFRANQSLASKLTGYKIDYMSEEDAEGVEFITMEMALKLSEDAKREKEREEYARRSLEEARRREAARLAEEEAARRREEEEAARKAAEEEAAKAAKEAQTKQPELPPQPAVAPKASADPSSFPAEAINPAAAALAAVAEARRREEEEAARRAAEPQPEVEETPAEEVQETEVKTTTTLSELERELDEARERTTRQGGKGNKRPRKITEEEVKRDPIRPTAPASGMAIYTEEELAAMNEEDESELDLYDVEEESDIDDEYSEYDHYYDDEN